MLLSDPREAFLRKVATAARALAAATHPHNSRSILKPCDADLSHLKRPSREPDLPPLPEPTAYSIKSRLSDLELPHDIVERIVDAFLSTAMELRRQWGNTMHLSGRSLASFQCEGLSDVANLQRKFRHTSVHLYNQQLSDWADQIVEWVKSRLLSLRSTSVASGHKQRKLKGPFNHEYVPLLEFMFEQNQFPSHADKAFLAKKSGMTYRQIHVWFQNRRNRVRKGCKEPNKDLACGPPVFSFQGLMSRLGDRVIPIDKRVKPVDSDASEYEWQYDSNDEDGPEPDRISTLHSHASDPFACSSPAHAFPAAYPPICDYSPFPVKDGIRHLPDPVWTRRPNKAIPNRPSINIDELCHQFTQLSVREGVRKRLVKKKPEDSRRCSKPKRTSPPIPKPDQNAAVIGTTITPPTAPLPSFIRTITPASPSLPSIVPVKPASSQLRDYVTSGATLQFTTPLITTSGGGNPAPPRRRKVAGLPKRSSSSTSPGHRDPSPALSDISASESDSSRASLSGSDSALARHAVPSPLSGSSLSSSITAFTQPAITAPVANLSSLSPGTIPPSQSPSSSLNGIQTILQASESAVPPVAKPRRRKMAALPKRSSVAVTNGSVDGPVTSTLRSFPMSDARTSSSGPDTSLAWPRCVSDRSSTSDEDYSGPRTPPQESSHIHAQILSTGGFDFRASSQLSDLFGDPPSPAQGLQLDLHPDIFMNLGSKGKGPVFPEYSFPGSFGMEVGMQQNRM